MPGCLTVQSAVRPSLYYDNISHTDLKIRKSSSTENVSKGDAPGSVQTVNNGVGILLALPTNG